MDWPRESVRIAIAGASSLLGKDLKQWIVDSGFPTADVRLFDEEIASGTLTETGGEPAWIETVTEDSFERTRFAFFTGSPEFSARHGEEARRAGATVIDLSGGLAEAPGAQACIPALESVLPQPSARVAGEKFRNLFLAPSAPALVATSLAAGLSPLGLARLVLTFFQPVSERGREGIEELELQVVKLLSFQPIPQSIFGAQVGFNMLSRYGDESAEKLADVRARIGREVRSYLAGRLSPPAIELLQAPVFYSHTFTAYAEFKDSVDLEALAAGLQSAGLAVVAGEDSSPDNVSVAGEPRPVIGPPEHDSSIENGVWLWGAADNLRVPAANAVSIAEKLLVS